MKLTLASFVLNQSLRQLKDRHNKDVLLENTIRNPVLYKNMIGLRKASLFTHENSSFLR